MFVILVVDLFRPPELTLYEAAWSLDDRPRKYALLVLDMQESYRSLVANAVPNCKRVIESFRAKGLPIFWTNWAKAVVQGGGGVEMEPAMQKALQQAPKRVQAQQRTPGGSSTDCEGSGENLTVPNDLIGSQIPADHEGGCDSINDQVDPINGNPEQQKLTPRSINSDTPTVFTHLF